MRSLTPEQLRSKLAFDNRLMRSLSSRHIGRIKAFASVAEARAGREIRTAEEEAGLACVYDVTYRFPIPLGPTVRAESATARFDLLAGGNFPWTAPAVFFVTTPFPWSPHVSSGGSVCLGSGWSSRLTPHLVAHVMRLLNFHEPLPAADYTGYNGAAIDWWRDVLRYGPLHTDLEYPVPPAALTHGSDPEEVTFRVVADDVLRIFDDASTERRRDTSSPFRVVEG